MISINLINLKINLKSNSVIERSIELCRKTDALLERLRDPILPDRLDPLIEARTRVPGPKDWTNESILELIRGPS